MKVLVTGGGGFLGTRITELLVARGDCVRVLGRRRYPHLESLGAECVAADIRDADAVRSACTGVDVVFHVAGLTGMWGPRKAFFETNVAGTVNVVEACQHHGVGRLVYTSSPSVVHGVDSTIINAGDEGMPYPRRYLAPYPESKARAEHHVLQANGETTATCAIRPHLIWGAGDRHLVPRIAARAKAGKLTHVGDGKNLVSLTYIDNAATAHLQAADVLAPGSPVAGKAYFVVDAEPVLLWGWIRDLVARLGLAPPTRVISYPVAYGCAWLSEIACRLLPCLGEPSLTRFVVAQAARPHYFSHDRATADFGYRPIVDNPTGIDRTVEWLQQNPEILSDPSPIETKG